MIKMTLAQWAIGKFCLACDFNLIPSDTNTGLVCNNPDCTRFMQICCVSQWAEAQKQMAEWNLPSNVITIKRLPWICGHCGTPTCDTLRAVRIGNYQYLQATCSTCKTDWLTGETDISHHG